MNKEELFAVKVPQKTKSYSPVPHQQIVEEIYENLEHVDLNITAEKYITARNGDVVTGYMDLEANSDVFNYRLAFQNSYNKQRPLIFVGGSSVMICSNGMILGETKFIRKHTGSVVNEMETQITNVIGDLGELLESSKTKAEKMKEIGLTPVDTAEICGRLFMEWDIITSSQLNIIKDQLDSPDHEEFSEPNLWSLYMHTTHALKKTHAYEFAQKHKQLQVFTENVFGV